jgi:hypothetical protein
MIPTSEAAGGPVLFPSHSSPFPLTLSHLAPLFHQDRCIFQIRKANDPSDPSTVLVCDLAAPERPDYVFTIAPDGVLLYRGDPNVWACPAGLDGQVNYYFDQPQEEGSDTTGDGDGDGNCNCNDDEDDSDGDDTCALITLRAVYIDPKACNREPPSQPPIPASSPSSTTPTSTSTSFSAPTVPPLPTDTDTDTDISINTSAAAKVRTSTVWRTVTLPRPSSSSSLSSSISSAEPATTTVIQTMTISDGDQVATLVLTMGGTGGG